MKKIVSRIVCLIIGLMLLMPVFYIQYLKKSYTVETYQEALEIEYDFTRPGITLEEVQELNGNHAEIEYLEGTTVPYIINGVITNQKINNIEDALSVLYEYRDIFKIKEYEYVGVVSEKENEIYYSFSQHKNGICVKDGNFSVVTTMTGEVKKIGGRYVNVSGINTTPILSYKECWKYKVTDKYGGNRQTVYVSAEDGEIVWITAEATV